MNGSEKKGRKKPLGVTISLGEWSKEEEAISEISPQGNPEMRSEMSHDDMSLTELISQMKINEEMKDNASSFSPQKNSENKIDISPPVAIQTSPWSSQEVKSPRSGSIIKKGRGFTQGTQSSFCINTEKDTSIESSTQDKRSDVISMKNSSPKSPYNPVSLNDILEVSNLDISVKTEHISNFFGHTCKRVKWIDEVSCLVFFSNSEQARDAHYHFSHPIWNIKYYVNNKPQATQGPSVRPKTTAVVARRLIANALELQEREKTPKEILEEEELNNLRQIKIQQNQSYNPATEVWLEDY